MNEGWILCKAKLQSFTDSFLEKSVVSIAFVFFLRIFLCVGIAF